ncbi:DUF4232 domain-containing protein [Rhodococcoides kroppenstedtii]|uniref:DUF4232 domain-containing protein n=1 Tax=Rhodococcoides kroppenstedtii TaxID=293050 RepID=UPI001427B06E|nr:DUF4232 domain-containing protein [Rhodococcus kroppenstedtii]NIL82246.1 hypothetical protein [Rhodococcus kroppenstedtii]
MSALTTARVLAIALALACLAVLTSVAAHRAGLCQDPAWLFGCTDSAYDDPWSAARLRYRTIGMGALILGTLAWLTIGLTLPRTTHRSGDVPSGSFASGGAYATTIALGPVTAVATLVASRGALVGVLAAAAWCAVVAAVLIWWSLHLVTGRQRQAWFAAVLVVAIVLVTGALGTALLWPVLLLMGPVVSIFLGNLAGTGTVYLFLSKARGAAIGSGEHVETAGVRPRRWNWCAVSAAGLLVIGVAAVRAAGPVPAPSTDVMDSSDPVPEAGPEGTPAPQPLPMDESPEQPAPPAVGLPPCGPGTVTIALTGWDFASGDSAVTLLAHNVGQSACALRGNPALRITQGGQDLDIRHRSLESYRLPSSPSAHGVELRPGERAEAAVFWRGYRNAADPTTPQSVEVVVSDGADPIPASIETDDGRGVGPAPFDVIEAAEILTSSWTPVE